MNHNNIPEGATHYYVYEYPLTPEHTVEYAKFIDGVRFIYNQYIEEWIEDIISEEEQSSDDFKPL